jgi:hypothetical protein
VSAERPDPTPATSPPNAGFRDAPLAWIDLRRALHLRRDGLSTALTQPIPSARWVPTATAAWPAIAPGGRRVACFENTGGGMRVRVCDADGVHDIATADLGPLAPVATAWSADGAWLAWLVHDDETATLWAAPADAPDRARALAEGSPLYFTWIGSRVLVHAGAAHGPGRVLVVHPEDPDAAEVLASDASGFCVPVHGRGEVIYAGRRESPHGLHRVRLRSHAALLLRSIDGLAAIGGTPDGRLLAVAVSERGDGAPYAELTAVALAPDALGSDVERPLLDGPISAFFWVPSQTPAGWCLAVVQPLGADGAMVASRLDLDGTHTPLVTFHPSKDFRFMLHFFEQYAEVAPPISPRGDVMLVAGSLGHDRPDAPPRLWAVPLDGSDPIDLGEGMLGVFPAPGTPR